MKTQNSMCRPVGAGDRLCPENCFVPAADGVQAIDLAATSQAMVERGAVQASRWLDSLDSLPLHAALEQLRLSAPSDHWEAIQAGFLGRVDQRLRSDIGGQHRSTQQRDGLLAIGDSYTVSLHQQAKRVVDLVKVGAVAPNSSEGALQLRTLEHLVNSCEFLGKASL